MIWFFIAFLVAFVACVKTVELDRGMVFFLTFVAGSFVAAVIGGFLGMAHDQEVETYQFDILAAKDNSVIEGRFGVFSGYIGEEQYYFFYRKNLETGAIRQGKIPAELTELYEDEENVAYIEVNKPKGHISLFSYSLADQKRYEIHVPPGSVDPTYKFDLE